MANSSGSTAAMPMNATLVATTLHAHCDVVPDWLNNPVYLDPLSTLYVAFLAVMVYTIFHRLAWLAGKSIASLWFAPPPYTNYR